jgi:hypothetical protein
MSVRGHISPDEQAVITRQTWTSTVVVRELCLVVIMT